MHRFDPKPLSSRPLSPHHFAFVPSIALLFIVSIAARASATEKKVTDIPAKAAAPGKIAGLLIDKDDTTISVKADGEDEPVKYSIGDGSDKKLAEESKAVFHASRVKLTYKTVGGSRQLVSIKRHIAKATGTVTGAVVKNYKWWIEVKPQHGLSDGYAPNLAGFKDDRFMEQVKALQPGDWVTIRFTTDFERHRIESLWKNDSASPKREGGGSAKKSD